MGRVVDIHISESYTSYRSEDVVGSREERPFVRLGRALNQNKGRNVTNNFAKELNLSNNFAKECVCKFSPD